MQAIESINVDKLKIPSLPTVYVRLHSALNDPATGSDSIGGILAKDVSLSGRLLGLANSAFFRSAGKVDTISKAVKLVGLRQISDLALASAIMDIFSGKDSGLVSMDSFWQHSIACGAFSRALAEHAGARDLESYLIAGMLHDVGSLVLYANFPDQALQVLSLCKSGMALHQAEKRVLGFDHAELGEMLAKKWQLPGSMVAIIALHHAHPSPGEHSKQISVIRLADALAIDCQIGSNGEEAMAIDEDALWRAVGLPQSLKEKVIEDATAYYKEALRIFLPAKA